MRSILNQPAEPEVAALVRAANSMMLLNATALIAGVDEQCRLAQAPPCRRKRPSSSEVGDQVFGQARCTPADETVHSRTV